MLNPRHLYRLRYFDKYYHCYGIYAVREREVLFDDLASALAYVANDVEDSIWAIRKFNGFLVARSIYE